MVDSAVITTEMTTGTKWRRKYDLMWKENVLSNQAERDPNLAMPFTNHELGHAV